MITINVRCSFDCWHGRNVPKRSTHDKWDNTMVKSTRAKRQPTIYKTQHKTHDRAAPILLIIGVNPNAPEGWTVPAPLVVGGTFWHVPTMSTIKTTYFWPMCCLFWFPCTFDHCVVYSAFLVLLTIVLSILFFLYFWPLYCLFCFSCTFDQCVVYSDFLVLLTIVLSILLFLYFQNRQYNGQKYKKNRIDNTMVKSTRNVQNKWHPRHIQQHNTSIR
jgi:hypothetical protein